MEISEFLSRFQVLETQLASAEAQHATGTKQVISIQQESLDLAAVVSLFQKIAEELTKVSESQAADLVTMALQETFSDRNLSLKIIHKVERNTPAVEILLHDGDKEVEEEPLEGFGGGPCDLIGIVLRAITILRHPGLRRILILDEPTSQISSGYAAKAARILKKLCDPIEEGGLGFAILAVTHCQALAEYADTHYLAYADSEGNLALEKQEQE